MNNFQITIAIVLLSLFACWEWGMCSSTNASAKMIVYNTQAQGSNSIYVSCTGNKAYEVSKYIPASSEIEIPLPPHGSKVWPPVTCVGKISGFSYREHALYISHSNDRTKGCEGTCYFKVSNNRSFLRWDQENKTWVVVPPIIWYH